MARKSETSFEEGDFVVYPTHVLDGLGTEEREAAGTKLEMLVVRFEQDRMHCGCTDDVRYKSLGLRTLSSKRQMEQAITTLHKSQRVRRTMWSRRAQEYETKIKSGDPVSIVESRICIAAKISPNTIQSGRCIRQRSNGWPVNLPQPEKRSGCAALRFKT